MTKLNRSISAALISIGMSVAAFGQITGNVTFVGKAPVMQPIQAIGNDPNCARAHKNPVLEDTMLVGPNGEFENVVVSIKPPWVTFRSTHRGFLTENTRSVSGRRNTEN